MWFVDCSKWDGFDKLTTHKLLAIYYSKTMVLVCYHAVFDMSHYTPSQYRPLYLTAYHDQIVYAVSV